MLAMRLSAALLATYCGVCFAQTAQHYTVRGTVVNSVTGEPIRRALVSVNGTLAFTGADGRFAVDNVAEGPVVVSAQKPGYFNCATVNCPVVAMSQITVHSNANDVVIKLVPEAKVQGRIVDDSGEPISNIQVTATSEQIMNGRKQISGFRSATTDENGNYQIAELTPGSYRIETQARPAFYAYANAPNSPRPEMYPRRFYPDAADESGAQMIEVKGGQTSQADFTLTEVPAFRISGSITPRGGIYVTTDDGEGGMTQVPIHVRGGGKFIIPYIPAGTWTLHFMRQMMQADARQYYAEVSVTAGPADVQNLQVVLEPLPSVTVHVAGESNESLPQVQVQLVSRDSNNTYPGGRQGGPDSPYEIKDVRPGRYGVAVFSPNGCVDTVTSGNVDLTHDDFVVTPESQNQAIDVSLRSDCATLKVAPHTENPSAMTSLLLVPSSHAMDVQQVGIASSGSFTFQNLSPGDYKVYAFSNMDGLEYANPEAMRQYSGQEITLAPNQQANITLDVNARGENQ